MKAFLHNIFQITLGKESLAESRLHVAPFLCIFSSFMFPACAQSQQAVPSAPTGLKAVPGDASVVLSWTPPSGVLSYKLYFASTTGVTPSTGSPISGIVPASYTHSGLDNGKTYYYVVTAVNAVGESAPSNEISAQPVADASSQAHANDTMPANSTANPAGSNPTTNVGNSPTTNVQNPTLTFSPFDIGTVPVLSAPGGTLSYDTSGLENLISASCQKAVTGNSPNLATILSSGSTYTLINVINLTGANGQQTVKSNNWYVYSKDKKLSNGFLGGWQLADFDGATRLYGASKVILISILLNDLSPGGEPTIGYTFTVTKTQATNVASLYQLLGIVFPGAAVAGLQPSTTPNYWACSLVPIAYKTSSIKIDTSYSSGGGSPFTASQTFTSEAKQLWDVSFALPVTRASALQYSSTDNTVTSTQINKQSLFAVADFYPVPVNLAATSYSFWPSLFAGVAMNSQPLHSLLFGASVGLHVAQVYAGALLLKQQQLNGLATGTSATGTQVTGATSYAYKPSFSVGIKISIRSAASSLSGSK